MGLGATYRIERAARGLRLRRRSRRLADARADAVHAPRVGARQPAGAAHPSRHGLHAHHAGRAARRRRNRPDDVRGLGVSRRGARSGRQPLQHRDAGARFVGGARRLASRAVAGAVLRRAPAQARVVRAVRARRGSPRRSASTARSPRVRSPPRSRGAIIGRTTASTITPTAICSSGICARPIARRSTDASEVSAKQIFGLGLHPRGLQPPALLLAHRSADARPRPRHRARSMGPARHRRRLHGLSHVGGPDPVLRRLAIVSRLPAMASRHATSMAHVH